MRLTLSDHTGVLVTHYRTDTTASMFDEWLRHLASVAEHLDLLRTESRDETEDERIDRALALIKADVEESGAVSAEIDWRALQKWGIALPWMPPGLLPKIVKNRGRVWVVVHAADLSARAWLLGLRGALGSAVKDCAATVAALDAIPAGDPEGTHIAAEERILEHLRATGHADVAEAFKRCAERVGGFWYA